MHDPSNGEQQIACIQLHGYMLDTATRFYGSWFKIISHCTKHNMTKASKCVADVPMYWALKIFDQTVQACLKGRNIGRAKQKCVF